MSVEVYPCHCGSPACDQYTLSTQGDVGFSLEDATLYASASDLLEALKTVLNAIGDQPDMSVDEAERIARAAILKATQSKLEDDRHD